VLSGVYDGQVLQVPMTGLSPVAAIGNIPYPMPGHTAPEFGVFVLVPDNAATGAQEPVTGDPARAPAPAPEPEPAPSLPDPEVPGSPDVSVSQTTQAGTIVYGDRIVYVISIQNLGSATAQGVILKGVSPAQAPLVSLVLTAGSCFASGRYYRCSLGDLAAGGEVRLTLTVKPNKPQTYTNSATVVTAGPDAVADNNESVLTVNVISR
jgi:uncharacterized repeat protein (TIGR01451 family)